MELRKGSRVLSPAGRGTVTDRQWGESLVQLDHGTPMDTQHGQWWEDVTLIVMGFDPDALVWCGPRTVPAGELTSGEIFPDYPTVNGKA